MTYITDIIERLRTEGREDIDAHIVADIAVPGGALPDEHPDHLTDRDPWSRAWDEADICDPRALPLLRVA